MTLPHGEPEAHGPEGEGDRLVRGAVRHRLAAGGGPPGQRAARVPLPRLHGRAAPPY